MSQNSIKFESYLDEELMLEKVHYNVNVNGLVSNIAIEQHFVNPYDKNMEAVYTFPLPSDAVLLGVEILINNRRLRGKVMPSKEADEQYEEALEDGNRAILVEKNWDGLYTVNVGNILPNDTIVVVIEYSQILEWNQDQIKLSIPTVIAPKYGDPSSMGLDDISAPQNSLLAENHFSFDMSVKGLLQHANINLPSHKIEKRELEAMTKVKILNDFMDKDITIVFDSTQKREERSFALVGKDFEGYAAIASFYPSINNEFSAPPKNVTFLVDCSGSMQGVSIRSARHALSKAVKQLNCDDTMNIVLFGSRHTTLFDHPVKMSHENEKIIFNAIEHINADMGGTEIASALEAAYSVSKGIETDSYLFLITDGETYDHGTILLKARLSKMRHFIVGVGDATDSVLLQNMAQQTKGAFENVDPNEIMDESILRVFKKIDMPKATSLKIQWSQNPTETFEPEYLYNGDTLIAMARFKEAPEGKVLLNYTLDNGENHTTSTMIKHISDAEEDLSTIARVVANKKLKNTDLSEKEMILSLSERYNLFSTETKYLLVDEVAEGEKPTELPQIHKVKHMAQSDVYMCRSMSYDCSYDSTLSFDSLPELNYCESPRVSKVVLNRELKNIDEQDLEDFVNGLPEYLINHIVELLQMASAFGDDVFEGLTIKSLQKIGIDRTEIMDWISKQSNEKEAIEELLELILQRYAIIQQINESDIPKRKFGVLYAAKQKIANWARQLF